MKIKICGITNNDDALMAAELGADALGFIFVKKSPRYINPYDAQKIIKLLPPFITPVGVVADVSNEEISDLIKITGIRCLQLHGSEVPDFCADLSVPAYKSFRVNNGFDLQVLLNYRVPAYLLDTYVEGTMGGTGRTFDWDIAVKAKSFGKIILAGGLTPENIAEAIKKVQPYAVDLNSGVESAPGKKDKNKLEHVFKIIRSL
ncbi:MAG: phosphoribosylanthranilate isomerase [Bacteroidetes bacterium]|nr:phosphoribosylanthranilate isomerase [Bacteroidota bacterium]